MGLVAPEAGDDRVVRVAPRLLAAVEVATQTAPGVVSQT